MTCLYIAVSSQCRAAHGAEAVKIGFSAAGPEVRGSWLKKQGYGGYRDWEIVNCEWFRREGLSPEKLESVEGGVLAYLTKAGADHPCADAREIVLAPVPKVINAFKWAKRRVASGEWDFKRNKK